MAIKISKVIADLNVGRQIIEEFLRTKGITIDSSINARIPDDVYELLVKQFQPNKDMKKRADQMTQNRQQRNAQNKTSHKIKTVVPSPKLKILGKIDLVNDTKPKMPPTESRAVNTIEKTEDATDAFPSYFEEDDSIVSYPLISEYVQAIRLSEDNLDKLSGLQVVLDGDGRPIMSSGNFAVVFKMKDETNGKFYALKCFTKYQEGRNKAYQQIAHELNSVSSPYLVSIKYLSKELFVNSTNSNNTEFPVVLMDWVNGQTLDNYIKAVCYDKEEMIKLTSQFFKLAGWLLEQPFAHGDLKPDNILVKEDGSLVLVDYDGMYVPAMKGQPAREIGSPNFRLPNRDINTFDRNIDDFPITTISLALRAITLKPDLLDEFNANDALLFVEKDFHNIAGCKLYHKLCTMLSDNGINQLILALHLSITGVPIGDAYFKIIGAEKSNCDELTKSYYEAEDWVKTLIQAAENGDSDSQYKLGLCYEKGDGIKQEPTEAVKWYRRAADQGHVNSQNAMGKCYYYGFGVAKDSKTAVDWFEKSAKKGHLDSQCWLGFCYKNGFGVEADKDKATMWYQKAIYPTRIAAESGDITAQINLGFCYRFGDGVGRDIHTAVKWVLKAAEQNSLEAQCALGDFFSRDRELGNDFEQAITWYQKAADQGYARAQFALGECYQYGRGVAQNLEQAFEWYQKAANQYLSEACYNLGLCYINGKGIVEDENKGLDWIRKAAEQGDMEAQAYLGNCYEIGRGYNQDYYEATRWYSLAAKSGDLPSQNRIEAIYDNNLVPGRKINWFMQEAVKGDVVAQFHLARCYYHGLGIECDYEEAIKWFVRADEQGYTRAIIYLGECYEKGRGVSKDFDEAILWYKKAIEKGDTNGYIRIGKCYYYADENERDYNEAYKWFKKAAKKGTFTKVPEAQYYLGECYFLGNGVNQNSEQAVKWFKRSAEKDFVDAQFRLGECYENGTGVDQNISKAADWYQKALVQGHEEAKYRLFELPRAKKEKKRRHHPVILPSNVTKEDINNGTEDRFGAIYSHDWNRLLKGPNINTYSISPGTITICDEAFWGCGSLQSIVIPDSVTSIGEWAFNDCKGLQSMILPDSVISIGNYTFTDCKNLRSIIIPDSVTTIGIATFAGCESLQTIVIPSSVTAIGHSAFLGCKNLQTIVLPDSVTQIGQAAFIGCDKLEEIVIPAGSMSRYQNMLNSHSDKLKENEEFPF